MKRILAFILALLPLAFPLGASAEENVIIEREGICDVVIQSSSMLMEDSEKYDCTITDESVIDDIVNYINSIDCVIGEVRGKSDDNGYYLRFNREDGSYSYAAFCNGHNSYFVTEDSDNRERYIISDEDMERFGEFLISLKAGAEEKSDIVKKEHVTEVRIFSFSQYIEDHDVCDYVTDDPQETAYILHYVNSLDYVWGSINYYLDASTDYEIEFYYEDGSCERVIFTPEGLRTSNTGRFEGYIVLFEQRARVFAFVTALKAGEIEFEDEIMFEASEWAESEIETAIEKNLVPKWNRINYQGKITRLEAAQLIDNFLQQSGVETDAAGEYPFTDTSDAAVKRLYAMGFINGKSEESFCPYDYITREEAAKMLNGVYEYLGGAVESGKTYEYDDGGEISAWAEDSVMNMTMLGIFKGTEENLFEPQRNMTKEEVIFTLNRMWDCVGR
ncbi:MAG: S-layer homology domain-containing protein [Clostridia bacterium]|nr:S-layer homology domain-containing protein [Clostridia bacterium]